MLNLAKLEICPADKSQITNKSCQKTMQLAGKGWKQSLNIKD